MSFAIEGRVFEIMWFSDVSTRDGGGLELWELKDEERVLVMEVFRDDTLRRITFATFEAIDIPLEAVDKLLNVFTTDGYRHFILYPEE